MFGEETQKVTEEEKVKSVGLFDILGMIEGEKIEWKLLPAEFHKAYSQFMVNRFISSKDVYVNIAEKLSTMRISDEHHYTIVCAVVMGNRKHYFNYKSYKKEKVSKEEGLLIFALSKEYEIGKREAKTYINTISTEERNRLLIKWKDLYDLEKQ